MTTSHRRELLQRLALYATVHFGLAAIYLFSGTHTLGAFPLDDAYIHHVYAEGIAYGEGLAYNPGSPAAGSTSPLWALLLSLFHWVDLGAAIVPTKLLGAFLGVLTALGADRLATRFDAKAGLFAGLMVAADPTLVFGSVSGMEVPLAACLLVVAIRLLLVERFRLAGFSLAAAMLARPEMGIIWIAAYIWHARKILDRDAAPGERAIAQKNGAWLFVPGLLALCAWSGWCLHATNRVLPTTFYAKHVHGFATQWRDVHLAYLVVLGGVVLGVAALPLLAKAMHDAWRSKNPPFRFLSALVLVTPLGIAWAHDIAEHDGFYWARYGWPFRPLVWIVAAWGLSRFAKLPQRITGGIVVVGLCIGTWLGATEYAGNCRNIAEMNVAAAEWVRERTQESEWVASNDAGAVRLIGKRRVVDLVGLNDHRVLEGELEAILAETSPRYYVVFESWFPRLVESQQFEIAERFRSDPYTICNECEQPELLILERR